MARAAGKGFKGATRTPLRRGEAPAAAAEELEVALLARDAGDGDAVLVHRGDADRREVGALLRHGLARGLPVLGVAGLVDAAVVARRDPGLVAAHVLLLVRLAVVGLDKLAQVARVGAIEERAGGGRLALARVHVGAMAAERVHVRLPALQVEQLEFPHVWHACAHAQMPRALATLLVAQSGGGYVHQTGKPVTCALGLGAQKKS